MGNYYLDGIKEGLASGYFTQQDWGWYEGISEWIPLPDIVRRLETPDGAKTKTTPIKTPISHILATAKPPGEDIDKTVRISPLPFVRKPMR